MADGIFGVDLGQATGTQISAPSGRAVGTSSTGSALAGLATLLEFGSSVQKAKLQQRDAQREKQITTDVADISNELAADLTNINRSLDSGVKAGSLTTNEALILANQKKSELYRMYPGYEDDIDTALKGAVGFDINERLLGNLEKATKEAKEKREEEILTRATELNLTEYNNDGTVNLQATTNSVVTVSQRVDEIQKDADLLEQARRESNGALTNQLTARIQENAILNTSDLLRAQLGREGRISEASVEEIEQGIRSNISQAIPDQRQAAAVSKSIIDLYDLPKYKDEAVKEGDRALKRLQNRVAYVKAASEARVYTASPQLALMASVPADTYLGALLNSQKVDAAKELTTKIEDLKDFTDQAIVTMDKYWAPVVLGSRGQSAYTATIQSMKNPQANGEESVPFVNGLANSDAVANGANRTVPLEDLSAADVRTKYFNTERLLSHLDSPTWQAKVKKMVLNAPEAAEKANRVHADLLSTQLAGVLPRLVSEGKMSMKWDDESGKFVKTTWDVGDYIPSNNPYRNYERVARVFNEDLTAPNIITDAGTRAAIQNANSIIGKLKKLVGDDETIKYVDDVLSIYKGRADELAGRANAREAVQSKAKALETRASFSGSTRLASASMTPAPLPGDDITQAPELNRLPGNTISDGPLGKTAVSRSDFDAAFDKYYQARTDVEVAKAREGKVSKELKDALKKAEDNMNKVRDNLFNVN